MLWFRFLLRIISSFVVIPFPGTYYTINGKALGFLFHVDFMELMQGLNKNVLSKTICIDSKY